MMVVDRVNNLDVLEIQVEIDSRFYTDEIKGIEIVKVRRIIEAITRAVAK